VHLWLRLDWTSRTDFLTDYGFDCDVNIATVRALSGASLACNISCLFMASVSIHRHAPITKKSLSDPRVMYSFTNLGGTIGATIYNILKLVDPVENIVSPGNPAVSFGWALYQLLWWWCAAYFGCIVGLFITNYTKIYPQLAEGTAEVNLALAMCRRLPVMTISYLIFPIAFALSPNNGPYILSAAVYYTALLLATVGLAIFIVSHGFVGLLAKIREKDAASRQPGIATVYYLMLAVLLNVATGVFLVGPLHKPFGIMLFLTREYIYMYLILQIIWSSSGVFKLCSQMRKKTPAAGGAFAALGTSALSLQIRFVIAKRSSI
jgi:hypothetical protein